MKIPKLILYQLLILFMYSSCIEPDHFSTQSTITKETEIVVSTPTIPWENNTTKKEDWNDDDSINVYYSNLKYSKYLKISNIDAEKSKGAFIGTFDWKGSSNTHVFYAFWPAVSLELFGDDPSAIPLTLSPVQYYKDTYRQYMVNCGTGIVKNNGPLNIELEPSLALVELTLTAESDMLLKTIQLTTVGAGKGKGISGPYKIDITDNSVNLRESETNNVTLNFGDEGLNMKAGNKYKTHMVMLPAKLAGLRFTVSGTTSESSLKLSVYDAVNLRTDRLNELNIHLTEGPLSQEYAFASSCGSLGSSIKTMKDMINYQGAKKTSSTTIKGVSISQSNAHFKYADGRDIEEEAYWTITADEWIHLSQTKGKGAANIDITIMPNMKAIDAEYNQTETDLSKDGTANTYMIHTPGVYSIRADVMGNGDEGMIEGGNFEDYSGNIISSATISGATKAKVLWQYYPDMIKSVELKGSRIEFKTGEMLYPGNAVIGIENASGQIIWSWQIWAGNEIGNDDEITNANKNEVGIAQKKNIFYMMDRDLGSYGKLQTDINTQPKAREGTITIVQYTDESLTIPTGKSATYKVYQIGLSNNSYYQNVFVGGILYQWGRKDPMLLPYASSSYPAISRFDGENNEISKLDVKDGGYKKGYNITVSMGIQNPLIYYKCNSTTNWLEQNNDDLWGNKNGNVISSTDGCRPLGKKTIYDPCPIGYMVPTFDVWSAFSVSTVIGSWTSRGGYFFKKNASDAVGVLYPGAGGISSSGSLTGFGSDTYYWSNTVNGNNAFLLYFKKDNVVCNKETSRGNGNHIRCMRINK